MSEHVRIDEGIKRGKSGTLPQRDPGLQRNALGQYIGKLPSSPEAIQAAVEAYRDGATCKEIAAQYGVSIQAIYSWLLGELGGEEHVKLVTQALTARIALADDALDAAPNPLELARAREKARWSRMDLERRRSSLYGQKQEVTHNVQPVFAIQLSSCPAALPNNEAIEGECERK